MSSKQFTRRLFCWLDQINRDCELPPHALKIALALNHNFNEAEGGMAWCGLKALAANSGSSIGTAFNMVKKLQARRHLRVEWGAPGKGHSNHYWMVIKSEQGDLFDHAAKSSSVGEHLDGRKSSNSPPSKVQIKTPKVHLREKTLSKNLPKNLPRENQSPPDFDFGEGKDDSVTKDLFGKTEAKPEPKKKKVNGAADVDGRFEKFWAIYPLQVGEDAARRAFAKLIKGGADPERLVYAAKLYAVSEKVRIEREGHSAIHQASFELASRRPLEKPAAARQFASHRQ
jgi:hypothetical protein